MESFSVNFIAVMWLTSAMVSVCYYIGPLLCCIIFQKRDPDMDISDFILAIWCTLFLGAVLFLASLILGPLFTYMIVSRTAQWRKEFSHE